MRIHELCGDGLGNYPVRARREGTFVVRPYVRGDRARIVSALRFLPTLYPNGDRWLQRRLNDVEQESALCTLAILRPCGVLAGLAIETPKGKASIKLSTIYVRPGYRRIGIGSALLRRARERWVASEKRSAYVTVDESRRDSLAPLLQSSHFVLGAVERRRYAAERNEYVYFWDPESDDLHYAADIRICNVDDSEQPHTHPPH